MSVPARLKYTPEHEWLDVEGAVATVGITQFAADALGDIVHVELPEAGTVVSSGESCGELESTKSVSDLYAPADGKIIAVNAAVVDDPSVLNCDPFGNAWLFRLQISAAPDLLDPAAYEALTEGE